MHTVQLNVAWPGTRVALNLSIFGPFALRLSRETDDSVGTQVRNEDLARA